MAEETVQTAAAASADGFVEDIATVFNVGARFDVLKWDFVHLNCLYQFVVYRFAQRFGFDDFFPTCITF